MVNNHSSTDPGPSRGSMLVAAYVVAVLGTIAALGVLSSVDPGQAPKEAWGHAVVVAVFAVLLVVRWRSAVRGSADAVRAVRIISVVLLLVNLVEACLPVFPLWMRMEMVLVAALMLALAVRLPHEARHHSAA